MGVPRKRLCRPTSSDCDHTPANSTVAASAHRNSDRTQHSTHRLVLARPVHYRTVQPAGLLGPYHPYVPPINKPFGALAGTYRRKYLRIQRSHAPYWCDIHPTPHAPLFSGRSPFTCSSRTRNRQSPASDAEPRPSSSAVYYSSHSQDTPAQYTRPTRGRTRGIQLWPSAYSSPAAPYSDSRTQDTEHARSSLVPVFRQLCQPVHLGKLER